MSDKQKSSVPMIMGIIGGVIGLPSAVCAGACTAGLMSLSESAADAGEIGSFYMWAGIIGAVLGLYAGVIGKYKSKLSGILFIIAALTSGITLIAGNIIAMIVLILFLIGAGFSFKNSSM